jgi:hypothetical protein
MIFRIQIGSSVLGEYAPASLELLLLSLFLVNSLPDILFGFRQKQTIVLVRADTGVEPYSLLQW